MAGLRRVEPTTDFPAMEQRILAFWDTIDAFAESNRRRAGAEPFVFYDGPPFATGTPHYGHLLQSTVKDIVPRFWTMRGRRVERRFGWDCHGLPIEALAQEALGLAGAPDIRARGIAVFNEQCRSMVTTYVAEWRRTITRLGRWVDFDRDYKTMDPTFMESVWWVFKKLWDQGRIYRAHRVMPYSWKLTTPLSNFEAGRNYKDVQDPAITVRVAVTDPERIGLSGPVFLLAWTTTPWTLPGNLAMCVGPDITYAAVREGADTYLLAEARLAAVWPKQQPDVLRRFPGHELVGLGYEPLFPFFAGHPGAFRILSDGYVSTDEGTGIVHQAPAFGEDDYRVCRQAGISLVDYLDEQCRFTSQVPPYAGQFCKDADAQIIRDLKAAGRLVHHATIQHAYPYCERSDTPLIQRAIEAWYVKVEDLRERMVALNATVGWVPEHIGSGRFSNWLREARDWNISRNRFWGSCLPVWINEADPQDMICIGSRAELEALSGVRVADLHKHQVDQVVIVRDGKRYRRTPEVLDCWFESGAMPYGQQHFPFAADRPLESFFPADFIGEAVDQTRGWFYTLLILGTCLFDRAPFRHVITTGLVLAEDGEKMSKRKKNYPDPNLVLDSLGADALRAFLVTSSVVRGEDARFSEKGLKEVVRTVVLPFWNALSFLTTYAEVDGFDPRTWPVPPVAVRPALDRWLLSVLQSLIREVTAEMEAYRLYTVVPRVLAYIDDLTDWYIRLSRRRFWKSDDDHDKHSAYATLHTALATFARVLAPIMPFVAEEAHQRLVRPIDPAAPASVHWCDFPVADPDLIDADLEAAMTVVRAVTALGRRLREDHRIKVRQPLPQVNVIHRDPAVRARIQAHAALIADELNVQAVTTSADEGAFCQIAVKPNFAALRTRCGPKLKQIAADLTTWGFAELAALESAGAAEVAGVALTTADLFLQRTPRPGAVVATDGQITVALDTTLTEELRAEGLAREFTALVQNARKAAGLAVTDRILLRWHSDQPEVLTALERHQADLAAEVLASQVTRVGSAEGLDRTELNGLAVAFAVVKA